jgi:hypothetical protein
MTMAKDKSIGTVPDSRTINSHDEVKSIQKELKRIEDDVRSLHNNFEKGQSDHIEALNKRIDGLQTQINEVTQGRNWSMNHTLNLLVEQKIKEYIDANAKTSTAVTAIRSIENTKREENVFSNTVQKSTETINKLFAELPHNNRFHKVLNNLVSCETYFIIDKDKSTFTLVNDDETLAYAFGLIDTLKPACNLLSTGAPNINNYCIEKEGVVELVDGLWIIKEKIKLNWGDSS